MRTNEREERRREEKRRERKIRDEVRKKSSGEEMRKYRKDETRQDERGMMR